jgi:hypothetical protein
VTLSERDLQSAIVQAAQLGGWLVYHTYDSRRSTAGFPDLVLVRDRVLFIECKTESGALTAPQAEWLRWLTAAGVTALVVRPKQLDDVIRMLTTRQRRDA